MRMHRGSSKGAGDLPTPEILPLSASPPTVHVTLTLVRGSRTLVSEHHVPRGTPVREILRSAGHAPEGHAVLCDGVSWPLDRRVVTDAVLTVLPTFSGG